MTVQFNSPELAPPPNHHLGIHIGHPWPLGASLTSRGVNFSVVAPLATRIELLLFADGGVGQAWGQLCVNYLMVGAFVYYLSFFFF